MGMQVTASILYDYVQCPQRVALDKFGDQSARDEINPFVRLLWERGSLFERETIANLKLPFVDLSKLQYAEKERQTIEAMKRGEALIYGGRIQADDLLGEPDLLRKETGGYVAGDIKSGAGEEGGDEEEDGKPKIHYAVQLALYTDVLERLKLSAGRRGFIWDIHGDEVVYDFTAARGPRTPGTLWDKYQEALVGARAILARQFVPQSAYAGVCKECHWYTYCIAKLTASDDLTLIPFLGRKIRESMQGSISTIAELAASNPEGFIKGKKTIFAGLGPDRLKTFQARAALLKDPAPKPYLKALIQLTKYPTELFFDIEYDPMRDICYLHGFVERRSQDNITERFVYFFADEPTAESEKSAFASAMEYFNSHENALFSDTAVGSS